MVVKKNAKKVVCKLTARQDKFWERSFSDSKNNGSSDKIADGKAFRETRKEFPSLKKCTRFE